MEMLEIIFNSSNHVFLKHLMKLKESSIYAALNNSCMIIKIFNFEIFIMLIN